MKHSIREHIIDPIRGKIVKVSTVNAELGSGITDKNGREIFEGDRVTVYEGTDDDDSFTDVVYFKDGAFILKDCCDSLFGGANIEIVGHVDD